jgi:hypothetical protein
MKIALRLLLAVLIAIAALPKDALGQSRLDVRAKEGENVYVIINQVKDEYRQDYEKFMKDVFFDALANSNNELTQQAFRSARWLIPDKQNEDKSWTYIFIIDPVVEHASYSIDNLFREKYSEEETKHLMDRYGSFMVGSEQFYSLRQSKY